MKRSHGRRHRGREVALRALFEVESSTRSISEVIDYQVTDFAIPLDVAEFGRSLANGTWDAHQQLDDALQGASDHWALADIGKVERAVLRLAAFELLVSDETPRGVVIDEAVDLAKRYAGDQAGSFVNGVLTNVTSNEVPHGQ